jgi:heme-degrading monooxygenase HmoA
MFCVLFEVCPKSDQWDAYLDYAKMLRPELEQIEGFVDNIRYRSLTREGWILSLSSWRDEKALVRWRTRASHHEVQERGRFEVFSDYHLRVGQLTQDTRPPEGCALREQRLDETEVGGGTTITLVDASPGPEWTEATSPRQRAERLGLDPHAPGLIAWDVFDAVLTPGDVILMLTWQNELAAQGFDNAAAGSVSGRVRRVRVVRDYGMFDRREAPQYYPDVPATGSSSG